MSSKLKKETIVFRVDQKTKIDVLKIANEDRRSLSDYLRIIIEDLIKLKSKKQ